MEIVMSQSKGERLVSFLKIKRRERRGAVDDFDDVKFAEELGVPYKTVTRWLAADSIDRIDIENWLALDTKYGKELTDYLRGKG